jgi:26S proteasome regulatory subunit N1
LKLLLLLLCVAPAAMKPRMLLTLDAEGQLLSVPVRLGQAVDVVAQAGRPKTISGGFLSWERPYR